MHHVLSKTRSLREILEKPCMPSRGHIFSPIIMSLGHIFLLMKSWMKSKMGRCMSKTRSLGQILGKPCVRSRGHIMIIMKLGQNVCLDEIADRFENGSKTRSLGQVLEETFCML